MEWSLCLVELIPSIVTLKVENNKHNSVYRVTSTSLKYIPNYYVNIGIKPTFNTTTSNIYDGVLAYTYTTHKKTNMKNCHAKRCEDFKEK